MTLKGMDWSGKTVRVISTHEGSGFTSMVFDMKKMCVEADIQKNGLAIKGSQAKIQKKKVDEWL